MPTKKDAAADAAAKPDIVPSGTVSVRVLKRGHERISKGDSVPGTFRDDTWKHGDEFETTHAIATALEQRDFVEIKS